MHNIRLNVQDSVLEVMIVEDKDSLDVKAFSNHSANLIEEWQEEEDDIWK